MIARLRSAFFGIAAISLVLAGCEVRSTEETLSGNYAVSAGGKLTMHLWQGEVDIRTANVTTARIDVRRRMQTLGSSSAGELRRQPIKIVQSGNDLRVDCQRESSSEPVVHLGDVSDTYVITIPRQFSVEIETGSGGLRVGPLEGNLTLTTSGSGIAAERVSGTATLKSAGGDLKIGEVAGRLEAKTTGGSLEIARALGGLEAKSAGGDIKIGETLGSVLAKTAGGDIQIDSVQGELEASTAGGDVTVRYTSAPTGKVDLKSAGGDVRIVLPAETQAKIDARTLAGLVTVDFPITTEGRRKESELRGQIGSQPPRANLQLRTSGGDIKIERAKSPQ